MPAETTAFGRFFLTQAAFARPDQTETEGLLLGSCSCCSRRRRRSSRAALQVDEARSGLKKKKVTSRCVIVSQDNLTFLPLFVHSLSCCSRTPLPLRARCTTTPTTGSALQKGPVQGVLPPTQPELQRHHAQKRKHRIHNCQQRKSIDSTLQTI